MTKAVKNVNEVLGPKVIQKNIDVKDQSALDDLLNELDGSPTKSKLGANALLGVSLAVAKAGAAEKVGGDISIYSKQYSQAESFQGVPLYAHVSDLAGTKKPYVLPVPFMNVVNGGSVLEQSVQSRCDLTCLKIPCWWPSGLSGVHDRAVVRNNLLSAQETAADHHRTAPSFTEAMRWGAEVYQQLKTLAKKKYGQSAGNVGDEGGVAPDIQSPEEALDLITEAIEKAGYTGEMKIAMDVASSEFYKSEEKKYDLDFKNPDSDKSKWLSYEQLADLYKGLTEKYPIVSIEDPFAEDDWEAWSYFFKSVDTQIVGYVPYPA